MLNISQLTLRLNPATAPLVLLSQPTQIPLHVNASHCTGNETYLLFWLSLGPTLLL